MKESFDIYFFGNAVYDLRPISFGHRKCENGLSRPREINTDCYLFHYIASGKGVFFKNGTSFAVQSGQLFISKPYEVFNFKADDTDPFHYVWIRFTGKTAKKLDTLPTVVDVDGTAFLNIMNTEKSSSTVEEYVTGQLHLFLASLFEASEKKNDYVSIIKNYIHDHQSGNITVDEIRGLLNLNRQYMSGMFRKSTGISIQQYIINNRMYKAKLLLKKGFTVTETAELCGYSSVYAFSKAFKKAVGVSPTEFIH